MTKDEAIKKLIAGNTGDQEDDHHNADAILPKFLASNGFEDVAEAYRNLRSDVGFWYA